MRKYLMSSQVMRLQAFYTRVEYRPTNLFKQCFNKFEWKILHKANPDSRDSPTLIGTSSC